MLKPEFNTIINQPVELILNSSLHNTVAKDALAYSYIKAINESTRRVTPFVPRNLCQGLLPSKKDEFDLTKGLGRASLQPVIDQLNQFKRSVQNEIFTKIQAMGPENAKDIKLAAGIVKIVADVYSAANCYANTIAQVNALVDSYLFAVDKLVDFYNAQINQLTHDVLIIKQIIFNNGLGIISDFALSALKFAVEPLDILAALNLIANELLLMEFETQQLLKIPRRVRMHLQADIVLTISNLNRLLNSISVLDDLNTSRTNGSGMYLTNDFLNDFSVPLLAAASYSFSLTNSGALEQYSLDDSKVLLPAMSTVQQRYLIDSRQETGTILVGANETESIISCGLDGTAGTECDIVLELEINDGETIIQAYAQGVPPDNVSDIVRHAKGIYIVRASEADISYTSYTLTATDTYELTLYSVNGLVLQNNQIYIDEATGHTFSVIPETQTESTVKVLSIDHVAPPDPTTPITWIDSTGTSHTDTMNVASIKYGSPTRIGTTLHAGETLSIRNWSLSVRASGQTEKPDHTLENVQFIGSTAKIMFLKAAWGFIPAT